MPEDKKIPDFFAIGMKKILFDKTLPPEVDSQNYILIVNGKPGMGKTTFCLHLLCDFIKRNKGRSHGFLCYGSENFREHDYIAAQFNLDFTKCTIDTFRISNLETDIDSIIEEINKTGDIRTKKCVFIDGFSSFNTNFGEAPQKFVNTLMEKLSRLSIYLIIAMEDEDIELSHAFKYAVDGIINLHVNDNAQRHRYFEIEKLRYLDYARGRHGLEFFKYPDKSGVFLRIYPKLAAQIYYIKNLQKKLDLNNLENSHFNTGIANLDAIITNRKNQPALNAGDSIFVSCEPGVNKSQFGLTFLSEAINDPLSSPAATADKIETVWVNFGPSNLYNDFQKDPLRNDFLYFLKNYYCYDSVKSNRLRKLYDKTISNDHRPSTARGERDIAKFKKCTNLKLIDLERPFRTLHPNRVFSCLINILEKYMDSPYPIRLVVDGIFNLCMDFENFELYEDYVVNISRLLKYFNALSLVFVDLPYSYKPASELSFKWINEVDFAGHLRWFEINNNKHLSFSLLKSRYAQYISKPIHVHYEKINSFQYGVKLLDKGWPMISMLSGKSENIHEANVFFKFFDQSYSNKNFHKEIFTNFEERYPENQTFKYVNKRTPNPDHWSFQRYSGVGHSNIKAILLKQCVTDVLSRNDALLDFPEVEWQKYSTQTKGKLPEQDAIDSRAYSLWGLYKRDEDDMDYPSGNLLPTFSDISVLCCQTDQANLKKLALHYLKDKYIADIDFKEMIPPKSWYSLFEKNRKFLEEKKQDNEGEKLNHPPWISRLFAMPSLTLDSSCFLSFFFEILFEFSNVTINQIYNFKKRLDDFKALINDKGFDETIEFLWKLVTEEVSLSPLEKINYQTVYFSRRWYSEVESFSKNDPRLIDLSCLFHTKYLKEHPNIKENMPVQEYIIKQIPSYRSGDIGFSSIDFYMAGVIKDSVAPETAFMFISELSSVENAIRRFNKRRGLPMLREQWVGDVKDEIKKSTEVIDKIIHSEKYYFPNWIPQLWYFEQKLTIFFRNLFMFKKQGDGTINFIHSIEDLRNLFLKIVDECDQ